jgi:outer membrane protein TolC
MRLFILVFFITFLDAKSLQNLSLNQALKIVEKQNIEINIAKFDEDVAKLGIKVANGYSFGKLDATIMGLRSNDAGNVFGFKLQRREASFADFGFDEFLYHWQAQSPPNVLLSTQPKRLNYPKAINHYDAKLTLVIPLYVGGKLSSYKKIAKEMKNMATIDKNKIVGKKKIELKRAFYDITLLNHFEKDLKVIKKNIERLKSSILLFKKEGYAKRSDLLEVESKLSNVNRMLFQAKAFKKLSYEFLTFLLNQDVKSIQDIKDIDSIKSTISLNEVLQKNGDIKKADTGLKIQSEMLNVQKSSFLPEVGAFGEYGSADDEFLHNFKKHNRYTVGIQAKINILNGGVDYNKYQQENIKKLKVKQQTLLARKGISLKYKKIKTEIKNLKMQIKSLNKELAYAKEIYRSYKERYKEGLVSINDVIIKQSIWIEKLLKLLDAKNKKNKKILEIEELVY